ncbi:NRDE family protein [uncultured Microscilla sp.]|uniref:NRDE family protein n=1 Tax=uncultured Microscilla sp. TaxID=432653 RepID=UPI00260F3A2F|nr:NRDE family protein [uncultured Microscilla sp.]
MCLLTFAWKTHPKYKLIFASNRDEFYKRNTAPAQFWNENKQILAGKDLEAGGTWMGLHKNGRFTALTNYRDIDNIKATAPSRGRLTLDYLQSNDSPKAYLEGIFENIDAYNGFNLLTGNTEELYYLSNYQHKIIQLQAGIYGLSNALLDSDWFKVQRLKKKFTEMVDAEEIEENALLDLMYDPTKANETEVQRTGLPIEREIMLSPMFIKSPQYGTCSSATILIDYDNNVRFTERVYNVSTGEKNDQHFEFQAAP